MPLPQDFGFLAELGVPATAIAISVGLVRGAAVLEKDANPQALKYVADLFAGDALTNFGRLGATLISYTFERVFGKSPLSLRFVLRSVLATTLFWFVLLIVKHPNWSFLKFDALEFHLREYMFLVPIWYVLDWLSLVKARYLIQVISQRYAIISSLCFFIVDVLASLILCYLVSLLIFAVTQRTGIIPKFTQDFVSLRPILNWYLFNNGRYMALSDVIIPSTLLTTAWTLILFISSMIAQLLIPVDYLRRFTTWWFRDIEKHPLSSVAKVAAALIIAGALAIKAVRWIY